MTGRRKNKRKRIEKRIGRSIEKNKNKNKNKITTLPTLPNDDGYQAIIIVIVIITTLINRPIVLLDYVTRVLPREHNVGTNRLVIIIIPAM